MRKSALAAGATLIGAAIVYYLREKAVPEPAYRVLASDGDLEIRAYPETIVAETVVHGPRKNALNDGYRILSDYLTGRSSGGEALPMRVPVLQDAGDPMASEPPLFDDMVEGGWRVRFVMPEGRSVDDLPAPPDGVELAVLPARRVGVARLSGVASDDRLEAAGDRLRGWLSRHDESAGDNAPEFAFYNSPMIPPPLRRCEVLIPLA